MPRDVSRNPVLALLMCGLAALSLAGPDSEPTPSDHVITVGPKAENVSEKAPAHLSIQLKNKIRWVAVGGRALRINFPVEGFPTVSDGTLVTLPPLTDMVLNMTKTQWFASSRPSEVNPSLLPLLSRADGHRLTYRYRVILGQDEVNALLVVQE